MHTESQPASLPLHLNELFTKSEVAQKLKMSERSVERLVATRRFPRPVRLGKQCYWLKEIVDRWLSQTFQHQKDWQPRKR